MHRIARIRMSSIGPDDARFDRPSARQPRFELDFTSRGAMIDSVVWLENGGGKTVFLTLLFHALRPDHAAQIGDEHGKRGGLEDFVRSDDVAHVQVEWHACDLNGAPQGERLFTGLVAERRPRAAGNEKVDKTWYALVVKDPAFTLDDLVTETEGRRIPKRVYLETIRERAKGAGRRSLDLRLATTQGQWLTALTEVGLDPALLDYQVKMNRKESGAASLFRFTTDERFLWFFLELVTDAQAIDAADETVARMADKLTSLPAKEREVRFAEGALPHLGHVAAQHQRSRTADAAMSEVRGSARALGARLAAAVAEATTQEQSERERAAAADKRQMAADRSRRSLDDERRLLAVALADLRLERARRVSKESEDAEASARTERDAWGVVPLRRDVDRLRGRADALAIAFAALEKDAEPLRRSRDLAGAALRRRLVADGVLLRAEIHELQARQKTLKAEASEAWSKAADRKGDARQLRDQSQALSKRFDAHLAAIDDAVERGTLRPSEAPAAGVARVEEAMAGEQGRLDAILGERKSLRETQRSLASEHEGLVTLAARAEQQAQRDAERVAGARAERAVFTSSAMIAEAAGVAAHEIDLDAVGAAVVDRLDANARSTDGRRIDVELRRVSDRRAVESLDGGAGLLPPRPEVAEIIERLRAVGVASVSAGWRHLAEATAPSRRAAVLAAAPALADGIVVAQATLPKVVAALEGVALHPATAVVVGTIETMQAAETVEVASSHQYVVPPAPALYDHAAATTELEVRRERLDRSGAEASALADHANSCRVLASELRGHLERWRPGMIALAQTTAELSAVRHAEAFAKRDDTAQRLASARERDSLLADDETETRKRIAAHERALRDVRSLAEEAAQLDGAPATIARLARQAEERDAEAKGLREAAERAQEQMNTIAGRVGELGVEATTTTQAAVAVAAPPHDDEARLSRPNAHLDPGIVELARTVAADETAANLDESFQTLDRALIAATTASEAAEDLKLAREELGTAESRWTLVAAPVRARADDLAPTPHAQDPVSLETAMRAADDAIEVARQATNAANATLTLLDHSRNALPLPDRANARLEAVPTTEDEARERHAETEVAYEAAATARSEAELERDNAQRAAAEAKDRARLLRQQAGVLANAILDQPQEAGDASSFTGSAEEAQALVEDLTGRAATIGRELDDSTKSWRKHAANVNAFAREETWTGMQGAVYRRLAHDPVEQLARDASDLVEQLTILRDRLAGEIQSMGDHRRMLVESLADLVGGAISNLRQAHTRSKLPDHLGDWSHKPFLKIDFESPSRTEIEQRLSTYVIDLIEMKGDKRPKAEKLLTAALLKCVAGGIRVSVLKPNRPMALTYVPIGEMAILSGGMRATAAIAMFCTLARVRAANRTQGREKGVATLILDNPFGDASAPYLVWLQRLVAEGAGIQLVYTTGIKDLDALRQFPNPIRLSNQASRRAGLAYVTGDPEFVKQLWPEGDDARLEVAKVHRIHAPRLDS